MTHILVESITYQWVRLISVFLMYFNFYFNDVNRCDGTIFFSPFLHVSSFVCFSVSFRFFLFPEFFRIFVSS